MFKKLIGNEQAKAGLRRLLANDRLPNSLIFAGDEGVGKRQFALEIAKALVCREPKDAEPCGLCPACRRSEVFVLPKPDKKDDHKKVILSEHPDVGTVIPFNRNVLIDAIRELEKEANFRPYEAAARLFIIDDAEKMNEHAANALLKTLEEPPATTYIILITSRPDSLLPTIRSRCQLIRFAPVDTSHIEEFLITDRAFSHDEARLAARFSRGSVGRAVSINVEEFRTQRERLLAVLRGVIETGERAGPLKVSEELNDAKNKDRFEENLGILESLIHDIWSLQISGDTTRITNTDLETELSHLAQLGEGAKLDSWLKQIEQIRMDLIVNINKRVATDALFCYDGGELMQAEPQIQRYVSTPWVERLTAGVGVAIITASSVVTALFDPTTHNFFPVCPLYAMTGLACPGCGLTRGFHALSHGDITTALDYNALIPIWAAIFGYVWISLLLLAIRGKGLPMWPTWPRFLWTFMITLLVFGVVRNIPLYPFSILFP